MTNYLKSNYDLNSQELIEVLDEIPFWSAPFGVCLLEHISYKAGITALDIGFGAGFPLTEIAMRLGNKSKVYGIDPWEAAIERTKKKIKMHIKVFKRIEDLMNQEAEEKGNFKLRVPYVLLDCLKI